MQNAAQEGAGISADNKNILTILVELDHTARRVLGKKDVTLEDTRRLADYVTQVRILLAELELIDARPSRFGMALSSISGLKERYWELEGMVKEVRNNLDRHHAVR